MRSTTYGFMPSRCLCATGKQDNADPQLTISCMLLQPSSAGLNGFTVGQIIE